jgi:hypothetical protein
MHTPRFGQHTRWHLALICGVVLTSAGCTAAGSSGSSGSSGSGGSSRAVAPSAASGVATRPSTVGAAAGGDGALDGPSASGGMAALPVLAQGESHAGKTALRITVNQLRVTGQLMQLAFTVTNTSPSGADPIGWQVGTFFSDGLNTATPNLSGADADSVDGVMLTDPVNAKRYLVARTPDQLCVCSQNTGATFIADGTSVTLTAIFQAPPQSVTSMTVNIPDTPPFVDVPVQR